MPRIILLAACAFLIFVGQASADKKVALVVGNGDYAENFLGSLPNSRIDAKLIADALLRNGFTLVGDKAQIDVDRPTLIAMVSALKEAAKDADMAVFYFSGHGIGIAGSNYLIPANLPTTVTSETLGANSLNANYVLSQLDESRARAKIMLIDACRIPFRGFADRFDGANSRPGLVISLAAQPNASALPGKLGGHSPYSTALNTYLGVQGLNVYSLLSELSLAVAGATGNSQVPWVTGSGVDKSIVFKPLSPGLQASLSATTVITNPQPPVSSVPPPSVAPVPPPPVASISSPTMGIQQTTGLSIPFVQRASSQLERKDYTGARISLAEGIAAEPGAAIPYSYRGFSWYREGTLSQNPNDAITLYQRALADLNVAVKLDPAYAPARRHRGNTNVSIHKALQQAGRPTADFLNRGIQDLEAAVGINGSRTNFNALGDAYLIEGSYGKAIRNFNDAIARDGSYAAPYAGLCLAYRMQDNLSVAREYARKAASRDDGLKSLQCLNFDKKKALQFVTADDV